MINGEFVRERFNYFWLQKPICSNVHLTRLFDQVLKSKQKPETLSRFSTRLIIRKASTRSFTYVETKLSTILLLVVSVFFPIITDHATDNNNRAYYSYRLYDLTMAGGQTGNVVRQDARIFYYLAIFSKVSLKQTPGGKNSRNGPLARRHSLWRRATCI